MATQEVKELSLHQKLVIIQTQLKAPKNLFNEFGKYNYRNAEGIIEAVKPYLAEHDLTLIGSDEIILVGSRYYIRATYYLSDGKSNIIASANAREAEIKKGMDEAQITGSASSYARKYALNGLFALDDVKDDDHPTPDKADEPTPPKPTFNRQQALSNAQKYLESENGLKFVEVLGLEKDYAKIEKFSDEQLKGWISTIRQNAKPKQ